MNKRQIVFVGMTFEEALKMASQYKKPCRFFNGISWNLTGCYDATTDSDYVEIDQASAEVLSTHPDVKVIFSKPVGGRGCEIVVQD